MRPRNRSSFRTVLSSPFTLVLSALALFFLVRAAWNIHSKAVESATRLESAQHELSKLEESQKSLAASVDRLSTPSGIEAEIRDKYHAVQPGESVAVIVDTPSGNGAGQSVAAAAASSTASGRGFWSGLLQLFGL